MADDVTFQSTTIASPPDATVVAADEISGKKYQRVKLSIGADGEAADLDHGQAAMAASLPVVIASDQSAVPVSGTVTASGPLTDAELRASAVPVSAASLPLPSGAATLAEQQSQTTALQIIDDWDESDRAKVNPIVGQAGIAAGAGAVGVTVPRVTLASDDPAVTALQLLDNAISGSEMQVDVVGSLPAGTNAIGKLAANSGVDIGDVDVTSLPAGVIAGMASLPAGTNNIGDVDVLSIAAGDNLVGRVKISDGTEVANVNASNQLEVEVKNSSIAVSIGTVATVDFTPSLDTSAYADGDVVFDTEAVTLMSANDHYAELIGLSVIDKDDQKQSLEIYFFNASNSLGTENSAPSISDANAAYYLGHAAISAAEYRDLGGVSVAFAYLDKPMVLKSISGASTVGVAGITRGAPTHTASGLVIRLHVRQY
jgi:hypothetical protein